MLVWTWRTWPDILIDFGREVYVPWQLAEGKVLYRDIAYFNGPLSPYLNSLWFRAFGAQLDVLLTANLFLLAALVVLLYRLLRTVSDSLSAFIACFVFLVLFAFAQYALVGNYNYVAPYSHELTHGVLLSLAGIACIGAYARRRRVTWVLCAGLALGLVFLTKIEVFLAALLAMVAGLVLSLRGGRPGRPRPVAHVLAFGLTALVPALTAYVLLGTAMPKLAALNGLLQQFVMVGTSEITASPFYRTRMGTDDPVRNLLRMLVWSGGYALVCAPTFAAAILIKPTAPYRRVAAAGLFALTAIVLSLAVRGALWLEAFRPLPLLLLSAAVFAMLRVRGRLSGRSPQCAVVRISLFVFAAVLLAKIALNARLSSYGFALAMPATLLFVTAMVGWVPGLADRLGGYGAAFRAAALGALVAAGAGHLAAMQAQLMEKSYTVAGRFGAIRTDPLRGPVVSDVLRLIEQHVGARQSLAVLPEGSMLNFLTRRINPTPYIAFMPIELDTFSEERMVQAFRAAPPDVVLLVHKDVAEYGVEYFGADYGQVLGGWLRAHYERVTTVGEPPHAATTGFGVALMRYRGPAHGERGIE
jgi:hypothetical protein